MIADSAYLGVSSLIGVVLRVIYLVVIARYLGPQLYGMYAYGQALYVAMLPLAMLGMSGVLLRELGRRGPETPAIIDASFVLSLLAIGCTAITTLIIGLWGSSEPGMAALVGVFAFALIGRSLSQWASVAFIGTGKAQSVFYQERIFRPLEVLVGSALLVSGFGVFSIVILHAVSWWIQAIQGLQWLERSGTQPKLRWDASKIQLLLRNGLPLGLAAGLTAWTVSGPLIIYSKIPGIDPTLVGQEAILIQAISILFAVVSSMGGAAVPVLSRWKPKNGNAEKIFLSYATLFSFVFWGVFGLFMHFAGFLVTNWALGPKFSVVAAMLGPAIFCLVPLTVARACHAILVSRGEAVSLCIPAILGSVVASTIMVFLQGNYGSGSAVFAVGTGAIVMALAALLMVLLVNLEEKNPKFLQD